ncbi:helix-turn-helix domain-containing protein [Aureimonas phyllosphaerae]|uniref:helix-turn-helix domain-containing protein n=1 Tax=Aureimonas phyllosphaerae TaxID=1166078 RepID=UPI003A5C3334
MSSMSISDNLKRLRAERRLSQPKLAELSGVSQQLISQIESGRNLSTKHLPSLAKALGVAVEEIDPEYDVSAAVLSIGRTEASLPTLPAPNASPPIPVAFPNATIGMYGAVAGGGLDDGKFILNGNRVMDVLCPPMLIGVQGAYGVFVHGNSMKPRYREGEAVFVNPHLPIRQEDYAVVQLAGDFEGDTPAGFVKQFISRNSRELVMAQHQPPEVAEPEPYSESRFLLRFPREKVIAVHRIVWAGEV